MRTFKKNIPLARFSNYRIGGPARLFFEPKNEEELAWAVGEARAMRAPVLVLGGGTNLLINDRGWRGLVVKPGITTLRAKGTRVTVGAGVMMADLLDFCARRSLAGLEWAGGLPGTVGGAIRGNAGCFGGEIKDAIVSVRSFDTVRMKVMERTARQCRFGYRTSIFKQKNGAEIVLSAELRLQKGKRAEIERIANEHVAYRHKNHPLEYPNVGSMFKNVPLAAVYKSGSAAHKKALAAKSLEFRGSVFSVKTDPFPVISAAKLIAESGLRGLRVGGAMFSEKHPNFIVNIKNARAAHVRRLMALAKRRVKTKFGVVLEEEVQIL